MFKKIFYILIIFLAALFTAGYFFAKPAVLSLARLGLEKSFKDASVSVKDCGFHRNELLFYRIEVKKDKVYDIKIKEAGITCDLKALLKKNISRVSFNDVSVDVNPLRTFLARRIDILNLNPDSGEIYIQEISYDNLKTGEIKSSVKFGDSTMSMNPLNINFLGGSIAGGLNISIPRSGVVKYDFNLKALDLNIMSFIEDFKLIDKFEMTGRLGGAVSLSGSGPAIDEVNGAFFTDEKGGVLVIKDTRFLENIAKNSKQPLDIIVESFRNYNYNTGILKLYADNGSLVLDVRLAGETGERNLTIVLHEFANNFTN